MRIQTRQTLLLLPVLILLLTFFPMDVAQEDPATLRISLPAGTRIGADSDPWLNEGWLLNLTGTSWEFTVRVNETSNVHTSYDTHLIVALNNASYDNLLNLTINGTTIPKAALQYGTPEPYDVGWSWSDDLYPTWFNDTYINLGTIQPFGYTEVNVSVFFSSDPTGARMHFDAYGKIVTGDPQNIGDFTWSPHSEDSTVVYTGVGIPPHAEFNWKPETPYVNNNVTFNATASYDPDGYIEWYYWNFSDSAPPVNTTNPITIHNYTTAGTYSVTLTVGDNASLTDTNSQPITIVKHPVARFTYSSVRGDEPAYPLVGDNVTFDASASTPDGGNITSYEWDFGDGTNGTGMIVNHTYTTNGTFPVTLNVTDSTDLWDTTSKTITVIDYPVANFTVSPLPPYYAPATLTFNASDSTPKGGTIISYDWDFGDGNVTTVTGPVITHTYTANGTYPVTLNVTDSEGLWNTTSKDITIFSSVGQYPVANFTVLPLGPPYYAGVELTFNGSEPISYDLDGSIVGWNWTIQNETMAVIANLTGSVVSYNFTAAGTYTINLTVTDNDDLTNSTSKVISIGKAPVANFTYSPDKPLAGEPATFNASLSTPNGGSIVNYTWNFGDNTTDTGMIVNHTYATHGNYTVTLNVTDSEGLWDANSTVVKVYAPPVANFTYSASAVKACENVTFDASTSYDPDGTIVSWNWTIKKDNVTIATYSGTVVFHHFTEAGNYTVTLTVTDNDNLTNSTTLDVTVIDYPVANFTVSPPSPYYAPATLTFNASGSTPNGGTIIGYEWNFGDGNNGTGMVVDHTYTDAGNYTVTLNVTDSEGLWNTTSKEITVERRDLAVISVVPAKDQAYPTWIVPLNISVTVLNNGTEPVNFTVTAYYDGNVIETLTVTDLAPNATKELTFSWNLSGIPYGLYDIKANATLADDANPDNNEFVVYDAVKVKLPGDADGNGSVGGGDLAALGWAWGTTVGMPNYNQECDFDHDDDINGGDFVILGWNWGKSVTY